ncbi:MAG: GcrA family cell cycle regulator [Rubrimonas sp.]|uniref:GcrA family cell cycle regulator n=1 Tax=Rubrimonas sp. TaxID=2036015 RepID=UPI002FDEC42D
MSWTDERVARLQEMWNEGLSAAQIAKELGGVTRNAVIGKVHRLGLSNRATGSARPGGDGHGEHDALAAPDAIEAAAPSVDAAEPAPEATVAPAPEAAEAQVQPRPEPAPAPARALSPTQRREPQPMSEDRLEVLANLAEIEKSARRVSLLDLTERVCKWPIGDPTDADFHFCGLPAVPGKPYCAAHVAVAFQPMSSRRDRDRARIRS